MEGPRQLMSKDSEQGVEGAMLRGVPRSIVMGWGDRSARAELSNGVEVADDMDETETRPSDME